MSFSCGVCSLQCGNDDTDIKCTGGCDRIFHAKCIKTDVEGKKTRSHREYKCKECRATSMSTKSASSVSEPTIFTKDMLVRVLEEFKREVFAEFKREVFAEFKREVFAEFKAIRGEMSELAESVKFLSDSVDRVTVLTEKVNSELQALKKENEKLTASNGVLIKEVSSLKERMRDLEQYSRRTNLEISGIPVTPNENILDVVKDIGKALGVELQEQQVTAAHRIPSYKRERTPSLIVQFQNKMTRDAWIGRYREKKSMTANEVNVNYPKQRLYINEHLSPENKQFLYNLKQKCRELGYDFAWFREGKFFVRKKSGEPCKRINTEDDINKLK